MSRKKNKNRQQILSHDSSENENNENPAVLNNESGSDEANFAGVKDAANSGFTSYLKVYWWAVALTVFLTIGTFGAGMKYLEDSTRRESANGKTPNGENDRSLLSKLNPFAPAAPLPTPSPTPLPLSKEYIYAGSRLLAVEDANATAIPPADLAIWRPSSGAWWVMSGQGSSQVTQVWGDVNDKPVPGDYDGDGKTDFAIFRPETNHVGNWYILYSATNTWTLIYWGLDTDKENLVPADYDGDGKTDLGLWRPANGGWYILKSSDGQSMSPQLGSTGDKPSPGDYDGDGKADVGVWRDSNKNFYSQNSSNLSSQIVSFSNNNVANNAEPVSADYDGDGKADYALRSGADWIIRSSSTGVIQTPIPWQASGNKAVHNDYDGDGKVDIAVWRDADGKWFIRQSSHIGQSNELRQEQWGTSGDTPVPAFYRR